MVSSSSSSSSRIITTTMATTKSGNSSKKCTLLLSIGFIILVFIISFFSETSSDELSLSSEEEWEMKNTSSSSKNHDNNNKHNKDNNELNGLIPNELINVVYEKSDFINERGIIPSYWYLNSGNDNNNNNNNITKTTWGPCYPPLDSNKNKRNLRLHHKKSKKHTNSYYKDFYGPINWNDAIETFNKTHRYSYRRETIRTSDTIDGGCRPGFIIIGAGKCGTSSLYHYLTGHPRVAPASSKQIHYFKYHTKRSLAWYYSWFPTTKTFLSSGTLMTGEASPGYLPYPDVARLMKERLPGDPKILMVGRDPLDRSYSSYRYNYKTPTIDAMKKGTIRHISANKDDEYYEQYLFTFEELMYAELQLLKECFKENGYGTNATYDLWHKSKWYIKEYKYRYNENLPSLIDMDEVCYGKIVNKTILRKQWTNLISENPNKVILNQNLHLQQALLGRSLYVYPLEWWYIFYNSSNIYFICTEELSDPTGQPLNDIGLNILGLPSYNFSSIVAEGAYNVGGHRGYDTATSWEKVMKEEEIQQELLLSEHTTNNNEEEEEHYEQNNNNNKIEYPLSDEFRKELEDFIRPINERLFTLTGRRCNWQ